MTVTHTGAVGVTANIINLNGQSTLNSGGSASIQGPSVPTPSNVSITPQSTQVFTYTATPTATGALNSLFFFGTASGFDANNGNFIQSASSNSNSLIVQQAPVISTAGIVAPATVDYPQLFTTTLTITNTGGATLDNLAPIMLASGPAQLVSGPLPSAGDPDRRRHRQTFTWTWSAVGSATNIAFSATAVGQDANSGANIGSPVLTSSNIQVQNLPALTSSLSLSNFTGTPLIGCDFNPVNVILTVSNAGTALNTALADYIVPAAPVLFGASTPAGLASPWPPRPLAGTAHLHHRRRGGPLHLDLQRRRRLDLQFQHVGHQRLRQQRRA